MFKPKLLLIFFASFLLLILVACDEVVEQDKIEESFQDTETSEEESVAINQDKEGDSVESVEKIDEKGKYIEKLNKLNDEMDSISTEGDQVEMEKVQNKKFNEWDKMLNEIYTKLENDLSDEEIAELNQEQKDWIIERNESAKEESSQYEGGSLETLTHTSSQTRLTKERCYELVADYMD